MVKHSPHKRYKGHCILCGSTKAKVGNAYNVPWPVLRKLGKKRRLSRRDLGDDN